MPRRESESASVGVRKGESEEDKMKRKSRVAKKYLLDEKKTMLEQFGKKAPPSPSKKKQDPNLSENSNLSNEFSLLPNTFVKTIIWAVLLFIKTRIRKFIEMCNSGLVTIDQNYISKPILATQKGAQSAATYWS